MHQGVPPELKTERTREYVSISICGTTQLSDARWSFETTSKSGSQTPQLRQIFRIAVKMQPLAFDNHLAVFDTDFCGHVFL